ncbi:MAG: DUF1684 domain-containing protein [Bacteroidota bacterium]
MKRVAELFSLAILLVITLNISAQKSTSEKEYIKEVRRERKDKDKEFALAENSPLDPKVKPGFSGLNYFKVRPEWRVTARIERYNNPDTLRMKTTTERLPLYLVYGNATFNFKGREFSLTVYRNIGLMTKPGYEDYLFIPFRDETSGDLSYGGGRYIDARIIEGNSILVDFNRAYNPYCVYSKKYSCPIPPSENYLDIPVMAGEKDFIR